MNKNLLLLAFALVALSNIKAQLALPYETGFDDVAEQTGWVEYRKGVIGQFQEWTYENSLAYSAPNCLIHYYPVGGTIPQDDWFVSPSFTITNGGILDSLRYHFAGFGTPQAGDTISVYLLNGSQDPDLATSSSVLVQFTGANYQNDNTWRLLSPISLPSQAGNCYIAFRYKTISNWLDVRFDNVGISRISGVGLDESNSTNIQVFPNPVSDHQFQVQLDDSNIDDTHLSMRFYNNSGQLVYSTPITDHILIDLPLVEGFYSYQLIKESETPIALGKLVVL